MNHRRLVVSSAAERITLDFSNLRTPLTEWEGTAQELHDMISKVCLEGAKMEAGRSDPPSVAHAKMEAKSWRRVEEMLGPGEGEAGGAE